MSDAAAGAMAVRRHQILALNGGGFRGLYTATFLEQCESGYGAQCRDRFDLIAGTSIGSLIAAGLACGVPASALAAKIRDHGPLIFRRFPVFTLGKRILVNAPYGNEAVRKAIFETLGAAEAEKSLNDIDQAILITAVNYTTGSATIFRSKGLAGARADDVPLWEAVLASAAAPTFFPLKRIATDEYADGGLVANAPDLVATIEAMALQNADLADTYLLSIGTAGRRQGAALHATGRSPSVLSWFFVRGLVQTTMAAQETLALEQAETLLGARHLRVNREPAQNQVKAIKEMDLASKQAAETLTSLATASWTSLRSDRRLRNFFQR